MVALGTLWRTVRHLKARQVFGRAVFRLARPRVDLSPPPALNPINRGAWVTPAQRNPSLVAPACWNLLNQEGDLAQTGWDNPAIEKLWRYNQHYFDDLNATGAATRTTWHQNLVTRWVAENPPGKGTGWEPYPTSLRIVNWVKWWVAAGEADPAALHSLAVQVRWLRQRLERHLLGNHLFANAKALVFAGLFFSGKEADDWLACGLKILAAELPEQVLEDGGHFERSPMYHALALEDVLDLLNLARAAGPSRPVAESVARLCEPYSPRMLHWLRCMCHPDGDISFFNDSTQGIAPVTVELERYARAMGVVAGRPEPHGVQTLADSGYVRASFGPMVALLDVAPVGPDYLPGHAHADTLSFELSLQGQRVVVNSGTSRYGTSVERLQERGTAAHSTVVVGNVDSSEVWSGFRVGRRARPFDVAVTSSSVHAAHDGYCWLPGSPVHRRYWQFQDDALLIEDKVDGGRLGAVAYFHLAPGHELQSVEEGGWLLLRRGQPLARVTTLAGRGEVQASQYAPAFGVVVPTHRLAVHLVGGSAATRWAWNESEHPFSER